MDITQEVVIALLRRAGGNMCLAELIQTFKQLPTEPAGGSVTIETLKGLISLVAVVHLEGEEQMVVLKKEWAQQKSWTHLSRCSNETSRSSPSQLAMSTNLNVHAETVPVNLSLDQWKIQTQMDINLDLINNPSRHDMEDKTTEPGQSRSINLINNPSCHDMEDKTTEPGQSRSINLINNPSCHDMEDKTTERGQSGSIDLINNPTRHDMEDETTEPGQSGSINLINNPTRHDMEDETTEPGQSRSINLINNPSCHDMEDKTTEPGQSRSINLINNPSCHDMEDKTTEPGQSGSIDLINNPTRHDMEDKTTEPGQSGSMMAGLAQPKLEYYSRTEDIECRQLMNSGDDAETELTWNSNDVKRDTDVEDKNDFWLGGPFLPTACSQEYKSESRCSLGRSMSSCSEVYLGNRVNLINRGSSAPRQPRWRSSPCFPFDPQRRLATESVSGDEAGSSSSLSLRRSSCSRKRRSQGSSAGSSWWLWGSVHAIAAAEQHWLLEVANGRWLSLKDIVIGEPGLRRHRDPVTGYTALHWAAKRGETQAVLQLLNDRSGTHEDVDTPARGTGYTALHLAALHGHREVLKMLVGAFGASTEVRDHSGKKPWQYLPSELSDSLHELLGAPDSCIKEAPPFKDNWLRAGRWLFNQSPPIHQICEGRLLSPLQGAGTRKNLYQELCSTKLARAWFRMSGQTSPISSKAHRHPALRTHSNF